MLLWKLLTGGKSAAGGTAADVNIAPPSHVQEGSVGSSHVYADTGRSMPSLSGLNAEVSGAWTDASSQAAADDIQQDPNQPLEQQRQQQQQPTGKYLGLQLSDSFHSAGSIGDRGDAASISPAASPVPPPVAVSSDRKSAQQSSVPPVHADSFNSTHDFEARPASTGLADNAEQLSQQANAGSLADGGSNKHLRQSSSEQMVFDPVQPRFGLSLTAQWAADAADAADRLQEGASVQKNGQYNVNNNSTVQQQEQPGGQQQQDVRHASKIIGQPAVGLSDSPQQQKQQLLQQRGLQPLNMTAADMSGKQHSMTEELWASLRTVEVGHGKSAGSAGGCISAAAAAAEGASAMPDNANDAVHLGKGQAAAAGPYAAAADNLGASHAIALGSCSSSSVSDNKGDNESDNESDNDDSCSVSNEFERIDSTLALPLILTAALPVAFANPTEACIEQPLLRGFDSGNNSFLSGDSSDWPSVIAAAPSCMQTALNSVHDLTSVGAEERDKKAAAAATAASTNAPGPVTTAKQATAADQGSNDAASIHQVSNQSAAAPASGVAAHPLQQQQAASSERCSGQQESRRKRQQLSHLPVAEHTVGDQQQQQLHQSGQGGAAVDQQQQQQQQSEQLLEDQHHEQLQQQQQQHLLQQLQDQHDMLQLQFTLPSKGLSEASAAGSLTAANAGSLRSRKHQQQLKQCLQQQDEQQQLQQTQAAPGLSSNAPHDQQLRSAAPKAGGHSRLSLMTTAAAGPWEPSSAGGRSSSAIAIAEQQPSSIANADPDADVVEEPSGSWLRLLVSSGPGAGRVFEASSSTCKDQLVIGRSPAAWASIPDQEISGQHATLCWNGSSACWQLADAGSLNGTSINGAVISKPGRLPSCPAALQHGDTLVLGSTTRALVECSSIPEIAAAATEAAEAAESATSAADGRASQFQQQQQQQQPQQHQPRAAEAPAQPDCARQPPVGQQQQGRQQYSAHWDSGRFNTWTAVSNQGLGGSLSSISTATADPVAASAASSGSGTSIRSCGSSMFSPCLHTWTGGSSSRRANSWILNSPLAPDAGRISSFVSSFSSAPGGADSEKSGALLAPLLLLHFLSCRVEGAVVKMVGADHRRHQSPCEDVVAWRTPLGGWPRLGLFCVFDGHHSRDASEQAQELLPQLLAAHLPRQQQQQQEPQQPQVQPPSSVLQYSVTAVGGAAGGARQQPSQHDLQQHQQTQQQRVHTNDPLQHQEQQQLPQPHTASQQGQPEQQALEQLPLQQRPQQPYLQQSAAVEPLQQQQHQGPHQPVLADEAAVAAALLASFLETDRQLTCDDGCTATALLLEGCNDGSVLLRVANVGDSNALLVDLGSAGWRSLTEDHRIAGNPSEAARLRAKNPPGGVNNRLYGLNIARMLGDRFLKEADVGFTAEPYISESVGLGPADEALVIVATDGLWDVLSQQRVAAMAARAAAAAPAGCKDVTVQQNCNSRRSSSCNKTEKPRIMQQLEVQSGSATAAAGGSPVGNHYGNDGSSNGSVHVIGHAGSSIAGAVAEALMQAALNLRSKDDISIMVLHVLPAHLAGNRSHKVRVSMSGSM